MTARIPARITASQLILSIFLKVVSRVMPALLTSTSTRSARDRTSSAPTRTPAGAARSKETPSK